MLAQKFQSRSTHISENVIVSTLCHVTIVLLLVNSHNVESQFCFLYFFSAMIKHRTMDETMATSRDASFLQLHNNSREENGILTSASDSTEMAGFYQSFPHCVLPNVSVSNISESEKLYFPLFEFVISLVLLVVVALPGLVGNFISIFILSRPQMRTSLNVILIGTFNSFV